MAVVVVIVSFLAFSIIQITPGDPVRVMLGPDATPEQVEALRHELWLDRPFAVQYFHWFENAIQGNLGISITYTVPVADILANRLPITGYLSAVALIISTLLGIIAGVIAAVRRGSFLDQIVSVASNVGIGIPIFWLGVLGIYFFSLKLGWLPVQGWTSPTEDFVKSTRQAIMPVVLLAIPSLALIARQTRSSMLEVINQDYIRTAFSKGLRERAVMLRHALKNALIPVITLLGLQVRVLVGGSVLVETIFNIPGMGRLLVLGGLNKDFPVVQGGILVLALVVCLANLLVDISYSWMDPRIKYE
jgi:peptide/nickel transport system permease protein